MILSTSQLRSSAASFQQTSAVASSFDRVERRVGELQRRVIDLRTTPLLRVMEALPRTARQVAERCGKRVEVELLGAELELDRSILDRLGDPLLHLVRNAVDHGLEDPETRTRVGKRDVGRLVIEARREKDSICIEVRDDGAGIDLESVKARAVAAGVVHEHLADDLPPDEIAALVFRAGVSTASDVSDISGRGVGMDAVRATIEALGGTVELRSQTGLGTTTSLLVPITAAVQRVLMVELGDERVAVPITKVERILELPADAVERSGGESFALVDGDPMLVLHLAEVLGIEPREETAVARLAIVDLRGERVALHVDRFAGQLEIYLKPIPELLGSVKMLAGMTVLGDGSPVFLLDLNHLQ